MSRPRLLLPRFGSALLLAACSTGPASPPGGPTGRTPPPTAPYSTAAPPRRVLSLDGLWQVQQGTMDMIPKDFPAACPVPGLVDMARPAFTDVGKPSPLRQAFWYRRTFAVDGPVPAVALLKLHKARYGTKVWINGQAADEHLPCFTPAHLDVTRHLRGGGAENEIVVRVGADRGALPEGMPTGWDFEKRLYIPGIYDSVELILSGTPFICNVQAVPDLAAGTVRLVAEIETDASAIQGFPLAVRISEWKSGRPVSQTVQPQIPGREIRPGPAKPRETARFEATLPVPAYRPWSPETPFLYEALVSTGADAVKVRFGMRSFRFDPATGRAMLNGKPYFLRGTNVCAYRFFEDADRGDKPWRVEWVRRLHDQFKTMHWNAMRWCIGFPPDFWYDIADESGWLIQDEFPIWLLGPGDAGRETLRAEQLIPEFTEWMRERWNHPCVVIWDAQNESATEETGKAIQAVRALDLSNRPWENGWAAPQADTDCVEAHPYLMIGLFNPAWSGGRKFTGLKDMPTVSGVPDLNADQRKRRVAILVNEYAWLWLNRDGTPTCLTAPVYDKLLGSDATVEQRRRYYARTLAAKTEFWRCHRECAGVLEFCGLGYSRAGDRPRPEGGATSDHFIDVETLTFEPNFEACLRDAFSPVGLMLDFWADEAPCGNRREVKVYVINDLDNAWQGDVTVTIRQDDRILFEKAQPVAVAAYGRTILGFEVAIPAAAGAYRMQAELKDATGRRARSLRDFAAK